MLWLPTPSHIKRVYIFFKTRATLNADIPSDAYISIRYQIGNKQQMQGVVTAKLSGPWNGRGRWISLSRYLHLNRWGVVARTSRGLTHTRTHTHTQMQQATKPENQNWPRVIKENLSTDRSVYNCRQIMSKQDKFLSLKSGDYIILCCQPSLLFLCLQDRHSLAVLMKEATVLINPLQVVWLPPLIPRKAVTYASDSPKET